MNAPPRPLTTSQQEALLLRARRRAVARRTASVPGTASVHGTATGAGPLPLAAAQHRMWLMDRLGEGGSRYTVPFATRLLGSLDEDALTTALTTLVNRHDILRTRYPEHDGQPFQEVRPHITAMPVERVCPPGGLPHGRVEHLLRQEALRPFDLREGPVFRALLVRQAPDDHILLLTFHHIAMDGGSWSVIAAELGVLYGAARSGQPPRLAPAAPYADYVRRERAGSAEQAAGLTRWTELLAGARPVPFPVLPGPAATRDLPARVLSAPLPPGLVEELRELGARHRSTLYTVVLTAAFAAISHVSGARDLVVGCASAHREPASGAATVGLCMNTLPVRARLSPGQPFEEALWEVRSALLTAQELRNVPFNLIVDALRAAAPREQERPLVTTLVDLVREISVPRLPGLRSASVPMDPGAAKFPCALAVEEGAEARGLVQYDPGVLAGGTARLVLDSFLAVLSSAVSGTAEPGVPTEAASLPDAVSRPQTPEVTSAPVEDWEVRADEDGVLRAVLTVFRELLDEDAAPDDGFLELGGQSLLAVRVTERLRGELGLPLTGLEVLERGTPRRVAALLSERAHARRTAPVAHRPRRPSADTVLVTGGTGGVGAFVVEELLARGLPVRVLARPESAHLAGRRGEEVVEGDLGDPDSLYDATDGVHSVIHAACTFTSPDTDVAAMRSLLKRPLPGSFVFVSSTDAFGRPGSSEVYEDTPPTAPLTPYGVAKAACERRLLQVPCGTDGPRNSVVRAPFVWGPHHRLGEQLRWGTVGHLYRPAASGDPIVLPGTDPADPGTVWYGMPWVHATSLARTLVHALEHPTGTVGTAVDGHVGWPELAGEVVRLLGSTSGIRFSPQAERDLRRPWRYRSTASTTPSAGPATADWRAALAETLRAGNEPPSDTTA